ncbi:likely protein kinase [Stylonychia lemnae]|uniref:Likely protein kinase n=1 Tax=Stylonychia lemnae TaxID=5949 RepID=A0A078B8P0_STYLE|nr:likely protein kinase [Stylonychia lemnae]|eukprot:CDW90784.1 likely protein kinase [Stylonychia lemnae]
MDRYWMFLEFMNAGCLTDIIEKGLWKEFNEFAIQYVAFEILKGLRYLHKKHIIHRDMKSDNIFLDKDGNLKIGDFGYAAQLTQERRKRKSKMGTMCWMAPEIIKGTDPYCEKVDIWSYGIVLLELIQGQPPYFGEDTQKICLYILTNQPPRIDKQKYSKELCNFVECCLTKEQEQRSSVDDLLKHPFIQNMKYEECKKAYMNVLYEHTKVNEEQFDGALEFR